MVKIGNVQINGKMTLAPMAGVTDFAFRAICTELGAALTTTEMVSAKALCYNDKKTKSLLYNLPECRPFAAQIFRRALLAPCAKLPSFHQCIFLRKLGRCSGDGPYSLSAS